MLVAFSKMDDNQLTGYLFKYSQSTSQKQNYVTTLCDWIAILSVIFLMITQIFQYNETQLSRKAPKLLWNILPNLNKKIIRKILSQERKLFAYLQECQQNLLILKGNYIWTLSVSFLDISDRKKILNFCGPTYQKIRLRLDIS